MGEALLTVQGAVPFRCVLVNVFVHTSGYAKSIVKGLSQSWMYLWQLLHAFGSCSSVTAGSEISSDWFNKHIKHPPRQQNVWPSKLQSLVVVNGQLQTADLF